MISDKNLGILRKIKSSHKKIVLVGGCFDLIHPGHITFLKNSKKCGDFLVVLLESDESVLKYKKILAQKQKERGLILLELEAVDMVIPLTGLLEDQDYYMIVKITKPDIIAITQNDPQIANKQKQAEDHGAQLVIVTKRIQKYSSSAIKQKLKQ